MQVVDLKSYRSSRELDDKIAELDVAITNKAIDMVAQTGKNLRSVKQSMNTVGRKRMPEELRYQIAMLETAIAELKGASK